MDEEDQLLVDICLRFGSVGILGSLLIITPPQLEGNFCLVACKTHYVQGTFWEQQRARRSCHVNTDQLEEFPAPAMA